MMKHTLAHVIGFVCRQDIDNDDDDDDAKKILEKIEIWFSLWTALPFLLAAVTAITSPAAQNLGFVRALAVTNSSSPVVNLFKNDSTWAVGHSSRQKKSTQNMIKTLTHLKDNINNCYVVGSVQCHLNDL
ncbi:hypothetical protein GQX74_009092 [Glossina fuscipes]|nr:hypothetical protein GQX74_009092 [Glossina fuscipes]